MNAKEIEEQGEFKLPPKTPPSNVISVRLSSKDAAWLRSYAKRNSRSIGSVARAMVEYVISSIRAKEGRKS